MESTILHIKVLQDIRKWHLKKKCKSIGSITCLRKVKDSPTFNVLSHSQFLDSNGGQPKNVTFICFTQTVKYYMYNNKTVHIQALKICGDLKK